MLNRASEPGRVLVAPPASSSVTYVTVSHSDYSDTGVTTDISTSVTIPSGTNQILIAITANRDRDGAPPDTVSAITWDVGGTNQSLSNVAAASGYDDTVGCEMWYVVNPTATTANLTATFATSEVKRRHLTALVFSDVDQASPIAAAYQTIEGNLDVDATMSFSGTIANVNNLLCIGTSTRARMLTSVASSPTATSSGIVVATDTFNCDVGAAWMQIAAGAFTATGTFESTRDQGLVNALQLKAA